MLNANGLFCFIAEKLEEMRHFHLAHSRTVASIGLMYSVIPYGEIQAWRNLSRSFRWYWFFVVVVMDSYCRLRCVFFIKIRKVLSDCSIINETDSFFIRIGVFRQFVQKLWR